MFDGCEPEEDPLRDRRRPRYTRSPEPRLRLSIASARDCTTTTTIYTTLHQVYLLGANHGKTAGVPRPREPYSCWVAVYTQTLCTTVRKYILVCVHLYTRIFFYACTVTCVEAVHTLVHAAFSMKLVRAYNRVRVSMGDCIFCAYDKYFFKIYFAQIRWKLNNNFGWSR